MQRKPVTAQEVESMIQNIREIIDLRERAFGLIANMAERIKPEDVFQPGMVEKLRQAVEIAGELQAQDAKMALFAAKCAGRAGPTTKPN